MGLFKENDIFVVYKGKKINSEVIEREVVKYNKANYSILDYHYTMTEKIPNTDLIFCKEVLVYDVNGLYMEELYPTTIDNKLIAHIGKYCYKNYGRWLECFRRMFGILPFTNDTLFYQISMLFSKLTPEIAFEILSNYINFCSVIWNSEMQTLIAGVTKHEDGEYNHLYYGIVDGTEDEFMYSNCAEIVGKFCQNIRELEENTYELKILNNEQKLEENVHHFGLLKNDNVERQTLNEEKLNLLKEKLKDDIELYLFSNSKTKLIFKNEIKNQIKNQIFKAVGKALGELNEIFVVYKGKKINPEIIRIEIERCYKDTSFFEEYVKVAFQKISDINLNAFKSHLQDDDDEIMEFDYEPFLYNDNSLIVGEYNCKSYNEIYDCFNRIFGNYHVPYGEISEKVSLIFSKLPSTTAFETLGNYMNFCSVIWNNETQTLTAGLTHHDGEYNHLYYGIVDGTEDEFIYSNRAEIVGKFCQNIRELEENTYDLKILNKTGKKVENTYHFGLPKSDTILNSKASGNSIASFIEQISNESPGIENLDLLTEKIINDIELFLFTNLKSQLPVGGEIKNQIFSAIIDILIELGIEEVSEPDEFEFFLTEKDESRKKLLKKRRDKMI